MDDGGRRGGTDKLTERIRTSASVLEEIRVRGRSARGTSTAPRARARCGDGSRLVVGSCGTTATSSSPDRKGFQRFYDVPERVLPAAVLDAPTPAEPERLRMLALRAVHARGALTERGVVEHWRLKGGTAHSRHGRLARGGRRAPAARRRGRGRRRPRPARDELDRPRPSVAILLSPFENLLWDKPFARRILGFDHLIEVYKPAPQRRYGYYVLPFLWRDRVAGRVDLKSERASGSSSSGRFTARTASGRQRPRTLSTARSTGCAASSGSSAFAGDRAVRPEARQLAVSAQLLDGRGPTTVAEVVERSARCRWTTSPPLRARSALVLFSRLGPYDTAALAAALDRGEIFQYWAHIVPTSDYGIHRESMRRYPCR